MEEQRLGWVYTLFSLSSFVAMAAVVMTKPDLKHNLLLLSPPADHMSWLEAVARSRFTAPGIPQPIIDYLVSDLALHWKKACKVCLAFASKNAKASEGSPLVGAAAAWPTS